MVETGWWVYKLLEEVQTHQQRIKEHKAPFLYAAREKCSAETEEVSYKEIKRGGLSTDLRDAINQLCAQGGAKCMGGGTGYQ